MSSVGTIQDNSIKIGGYFQITNPNDKSINEIFEITSIEYDPSKNQNKIIGYSIDELDYSIEIIQGRNYFYIEGFDQGYNVHFEENIDDFYKQEILATTLPEFVQKHLDEINGWDEWFALSENPEIPIEFIDETLGKPGYQWEWFNIGANRNITPKFIQEHLDKIADWNQLSSNPGIPIEFIDETWDQPGYKWKWGYIVRNESITPEFVKLHLGEIEEWGVLSQNPGIPIEFIEETLYKEGYEWEWDYIEGNLNITPDFVQEHLDEIGNWSRLSKNSGIPIEFIDETLYQEGYEWKFYSIVGNPNITPEFVRKHLDEIDNWRELSKNPGIPIEFIDETCGQPGYQWNWLYVFSNQNITPEFIQGNLHKITAWYILSQNPVIPIEFIDETWGQPGYQWTILNISHRKQPYNKKPMIKAARS